MRKTDLPYELEHQIADLQARFPSGLSGIRCRSSTNNEDLEGFNGAGLYDSYTHRPDEGALSKTVKQVWASLWNLRAYDEREFHRIDHMAAAMGVLVHPNFDDEASNGVAVTKNPYDPNWPGFYVNVQVGESLVTNPDPNATPAQIAELTDALATIQERFREVYGRQDDDGFAMDVELKFAAAPAGPGLVVKQARPWVE